MLGLALLLLLRDPQPMRAAALVAAISAVFVVPAALAVVPDLDPLWPSRAAAAALARHPPGPGEAVLSVGYSEPSLVFLLGTATRLVTARPGDGQLAGAGMALVNDRDDAEFLRSLGRQRADRPSARPRRGARLFGGRRQAVLTLYRLEPG